MIELVEAHKQDPERYHWPIEEIHHLMNRAKLQLKSGTYPKTCPVLLATYRKMKMKGITYDN